MNTLEQLKQYSTVVADTGDFAAIQQFQPTDATTNPSLILKAMDLPQYRPLLDGITQLSLTASEKLDLLTVRMGCEILKMIPGRVSTEVDARLSFDTQATVDKALKIITLYKENGINPNRILIKIAATWEGILAAEQLERQGIHCNMTLLFSLPQAIACANAKVTLISPFVGRVLDWYKKQAGTQWNEATYTGQTDPGVQFVQSVMACYQKFNVPTAIMAASFRNPHEIIALAGCDLLTISPELLAQLQSMQQTVTPSHLDLASCKIDSLTLSESEFRLLLNHNAMATEKLAEGIRTFIADTEKMLHRLQ